MSDYTKGPWNYEVDTERIIGYAHEVIAWMKLSASNPSKASVNGRLIAAAPELLQGLKDALEYIGIPPEDCFEDSQFGRAYAAIEKAKGK
jgi:hypothetical protein